MTEYPLPQGYDSRPADYEGDLYLESQIRAAFEAGGQAVLEAVSASMNINLLEFVV